MILQILKKAFVVAPFNPDDNRMALPDDIYPRRTTKTATKKVDDDVFYNHVSQNYLRQTADKDGRSVAWEVVKTVEQADTSKARVANISDNDRQEFANRNLETDKAIIIKPYWVRRVARLDAAKMINQKGIHQRLIGEYYAAFSAALGEKED